MPTYKGNIGNLLQHWVFVELVELLKGSHCNDLCYFDAYSMSPFAKRESNTKPNIFDEVKDQLSKKKSNFEIAWNELSNNYVEYPSSAMFLNHIWQKPLNLILCESDSASAKEIEDWKNGLGNNREFEIWPADWKKRLILGLPEGNGAYFLSFDPYMFERNFVSKQKNGNMYTSDLAIIAKAITKISKPEIPIIIQLSTYSANNSNSQTDVIDTITAELCSSGLQISHVSADGNNMSLVLYQNIDASRIQALGNIFNNWKSDISRC